MQTTKARARMIKGTSVWLVTHADTPVTAIWPLPHDAAQMLIESAVVDAQLGIKQRSMTPCAEARA